MISLTVNKINCDTSFIQPNHIVTLMRNQWSPAALYYLLCAIYSPRDSHYICFSLDVESGHKMCSLTLSLGVRGPVLQERNGF